MRTTGHVVIVAHNRDQRITSRAIRCDAIRDVDMCRIVSAIDRHRRGEQNRLTG
jgi:hypothetical protein